MPGHRIKRTRTRVLHFRLDGNEVEAFERETVAGALLATGVRGFGFRWAIDTKRGIYWNYGTPPEMRCRGEPTRAGSLLPAGAGRAGSPVGLMKTHDVIVLDGWRDDRQDSQDRPGRLQLCGDFAALVRAAGAGGDRRVLRRGPARNRNAGLTLQHCTPHWRAADSQSCRPPCGQPEGRRCLRKFQGLGNSLGDNPTHPRSHQRVRRVCELLRTRRLGRGGGSIHGLRCPSFGRISPSFFVRLAPASSKTARALQSRMTSMVDNLSGSEPFRPAPKPRSISSGGRALRRARRSGRLIGTSGRRCAAPWKRPDFRRP